MGEWDRIERLRRIRERKEKQEKIKEDNHWIFLAGTLVAKYLKEDLGICIYNGKGAAKKNADSFVPLENILYYLSVNKEFTERIKAMPCEAMPCEASPKDS